MMKRLDEFQLYAATIEWVILKSKFAKFQIEDECDDLCSLRIIHKNSLFITKRAKEYTNNLRLWIANNNLIRVWECNRAVPYIIVKKVQLSFDFLSENVMKNEHY